MCYKQTFLPVFGKFKATDIHLDVSGKKQRFSLSGVGELSEPIFCEF